MVTTIHLGICITRVPIVRDRTSNASKNGSSKMSRHPYYYLVIVGIIN